MKVPLFDPIRNYTAIAQELEDAALRVMRSGNYILGSEVEAFEHALSATLANRPVVGVSSGTDALILALKALGVGPGETTADGRISLDREECLGSCGTAPVLRVDGRYCENLDLDSARRIVDELE